jgi:hypothetical protein
MRTQRADWDLLALMRANVGGEKDPTKVRMACEDAIAEYRARTAAKRNSEQAHLGVLSALRDPS